MRQKESPGRTRTLPAGPLPDRRESASPLDSPPFPNGDRSYGASPDIGAFEANAYPEMIAQRTDSKPCKLYGRIAPGLDLK